MINIDALKETEIFGFSEFQLLQNNNLQIQRVTKADEGIYRCEARVEARGEIDFRDIILVVNGKFGKRSGLFGSGSHQVVHHS